MRLRRAARAIVLDPAERILLVHFRFPRGSFWATPGGGIDEGETPEQTIVRELDEETGLVDFELGPWVWTRTHVFPFENGLWDGQVEQYMLVRTRAFEPAPRFTPDELAAEYVAAIRWWTATEIAESGERFAPRRLPALLAALIRDGPPGEPFDVGV
jgi:8-oxo-dGTP pyrophosphatase MutT (NUDIX family)